MTVKGRWSKGVSSAHKITENIIIIHYYTNRSTLYTSIHSVRLNKAVTSGQTSVPVAETLLDQSAEGYKLVI